MRFVASTPRLSDIRSSSGQRHIQCSVFEGKPQGLTPFAHVVALTVADIELGHQLITDHNFSMWDSLIVASALNANCTTLYSEDMQHGQIVHGKLTIQNPFS